MEEPDHIPLRFSDEPISNRPTWVAGGLVLVLICWMGSGFFSIDPQNRTSMTVEKPDLTAVAVTESTVEQVTQYFVAEGQSAPERATLILSEVAGRVMDVFVDKGDIVQAGQAIARLDVSEATANLESAIQAQDQAQRTFSNAERLLARSSTTQDAMNIARTNLALANAQLLRAQKALEYGTIVVPFAGHLERFNIEIGEYIQAGAEVAYIVDNDPLTVSFQVPQRTIRDLSTGIDADIEFITGENKVGILTFLARSADPQTHTFEGEVHVDNTHWSIPAGVSAEIRIPIKQQQAHFISPSILSVEADGTLGVKTVDETGTVVLFSVEVIRSQIDGLWVIGLPDVVRVISIGQGFVNPGEIVQPQLISDELDSRHE